MVRKSALGLVFGLALCLGAAVAPALAMDVQFELGVWNPNVQYSGNPANFQVWMEPYLEDADEVFVLVDSETPPYGETDSKSIPWERHAPKLEESDLPDNVMLQASFGLDEESRISVSYWGAVVSGTAGSATEPMDIDWSNYEWVGIGLPNSELGDQEGYGSWPAFDDELVYPVASYKVKASSFELAYDRRVADTGSLKVDVAAGLRSISFEDEAQSAVRFLDEDYYGDFLEFVGEETISVSGESKTTAFGPSLRVKADAALTDRISVVANLGYSYLFGESTASGSSLQRYATTEYDEVGPIPIKDDIDEVVYEGEFSAQIPVIDAQLGVKYALSDAASFSIGYKASRWIGVPMAPKFDWYGEMPIMNEKQDIGFSGLNAELVYRF